MKKITLLALVAIAFTACSKEEITPETPEQQQPTNPVQNVEYYNLPVDGSARFIGTIDGSTAQFIEGENGVTNAATVAYNGNNTTLGSEFTVRENGAIIGKLIIAKRYINQSYINDTASVRQFLAPKAYTFAQGNSNNGVVITYIDNNNVVWTSTGTQNGANFEIKSNVSSFSRPCNVDTYEVKAKIDMACHLYNGNKTIQISGSAVSKFAVAY